MTGSGTGEKVEERTEEGGVFVLALVFVAGASSEQRREAMESLLDSIQG
jgi:hypothetical protein